MTQQGYGNQPDPRPADDAEVVDREDTTERSLGVPAFEWDSDEGSLGINIEVDLPAEPPGSENGENVVYQVWGFMQDSETPPNAVAWGTSTNRFQDEDGGVSTPFPRKRGTPGAIYAGAQIKSYFAVQVTVRRDVDRTVNIDETLKVFTVPPSS